MPKQYTCWADHGEDLTTAVREAYMNNVWVVGQKDDAGSEWVVVVTCSESHRNAFSGLGEP